MGEPLTHRVATRYLTAYFKPGEYILFGKFKNKRGKIVRMFLDEKGNPKIELQPIPKGRKKNRTMGLYTIRKMSPDKVPEAMAMEEAALKKKKGVVERYLTGKYKQKKEVKSENGGKTTVYVYSERQIADRNRKKAERLQKLGRAIRRIRAKVKKDMKSSNPETARTALAVALMDHTYERIGNDQSAKDGHYGVTGWKRSQVSFKPDGAFIKYVGKSGVKQEKKVADKAIQKALRQAYDDMDGGDSNILAWDGGKVTADKVNAYLKPFEVTSKDIRGYHANDEMRKRLKAARKGALPSDPKKRKAKLKEEFKKALEETAEAVGHEASTLKSQYLVPGLAENYLKDGSIIDKLGAFGLAIRLASAPKTMDDVGPGDHYTVICPSCGTVVSQCRCSGPNKIIIHELCEDCGGAPEEF